MPRRNGMYAYINTLWSCLVNSLVLSAVTPLFCLWCPVVAWFSTEEGTSYFKILCPLCFRPWRKCLFQWCVVPGYFNINKPASEQIIAVRQLNNAWKTVLISFGVLGLRKCTVLFSFWVLVKFTYSLWCVYIYITDMPNKYGWLWPLFPVYISVQIMALSTTPPPPPPPE